MDKLSYQEHLVDEYKSYLKKAVANHPNKFVLTPEELAKALLRAFEKGAAKGVLYESINDVERISNQTDFRKTQKTEQKESKQSYRASEEQAYKALVDLLKSVL